MQGEVPHRTSCRITPFWSEQIWYGLLTELRAVNWRVAFSRQGTGAATVHGSWHLFRLHTVCNVLREISSQQLHLSHYHTDSSAKLCPITGDILENFVAVLKRRDVNKSYLRCGSRNMKHEHERRINTWVSKGRLCNVV